MKSVRLLPLLGVACTLLLAGCGNSRTPVPNALAPAAPNGFRTLALPTAGVVVDAPRDWALSTSSGRLQAVMASGSAVVAIWSFPRLLPPPTGVALDQERARLVAAARRKDPGFTLIRARVGAVGGAPAVVLQAYERIRGQLRRVRSAHLFLAHAELVVDEYAPPSLFATVARSVFLPVTRSLLVRAPAA